MCNYSFGKDGYTYIKAAARGRPKRLLFIRKCGNGFIPPLRYVLAEAKERCPGQPASQMSRPFQHR